MTREEAINKWIIPAIKNTWNERRCEDILEALEQEQKNISELVQKAYEDGKKLGHEECKTQFAKFLSELRSEDD